MNEVVVVLDFFRIEGKIEVECGESVNLFFSRTISSSLSSQILDGDVVRLEFVRLFGNVIVQEASVRLDFRIGEKGDKGDKPIKGVDYLLPEDVADIAEKVSVKIDEDIRAEITQLELPVTKEITSIRVNCPCRKKPRVKIVAEDGLEYDVNVFHYKNGNIEVSWGKEVNGILIVN